MTPAPESLLKPVPGPRLRTLLRREESYGIHALRVIAEQPGIGAAEVAEHLQIPPAYLAKVLSNLTKAGLVEARMGRKGGLWLRTDLSQLSLLAVIEALSGPVVMDTCQTKPRCATEQLKGHCRLKPVWLESTLQIRGLLDSYKLDQLLERGIP
ncbi:MAG: Rrf2 family transcriptional regulator [Meiothermus sp.]|nr:Rrf2 family transcriptional regulator [Meiothermus sp.]